MSGSYKINSVEFEPQPTSGRWIPREELAVDGNLQAIYPLYYQFEITWQLEKPSDYKEIQDLFEGMSSIGDIVADLPEYGAATYTFFAYSGCVLREPQMGIFFREHNTDVKLLIAKIRI